MRTGKIQLRRGMRGFTVMEMILAVTLMAILSIPVTVLLQGAASTNSFMNSATDAGGQMEMAYRRIAYNLRMASALSAPTTTTTGSTLTLVTQPDAANGNKTYTVTYTLSGTNLTENDSRYNGAGGTANVLVSNVTAFQVTRQSMSSPTVVQVTITAGTSTMLTRQVNVLCRNF